MATSLEERFKRFLAGLPGAEDIDACIPEEKLAHRKRADYLLRNRQIVLELKTLTNDPGRKVQERLSRHQERPEFPVFYWESDLNEILSYLPDGEAVRHEIFHALTRVVQGAFEDADDQVQETKAVLSLTDACGVLAILNQNIGALSPDLIVAKANQMLLKKRDGNIRYTNIAYVWLISESHEIVVPGSTVHLPLLLLEGPMADMFPEVGDYLSELNVLWARHQGVPLRGGERISNFEKTVFKDLTVKPDPVRAPSGMIRRQDLWEREYSSKPYLRSLSEADFLTHTARILAVLGPQFLKGRRRLSDIQIHDLMRGWTEALVEAKHRRLDMRKLRPYLEHEERTI